MTIFFIDSSGSMSNAQIVGAARYVVSRLPEVDKILVLGGPGFSPEAIPVDPLAFFADPVGTVGQVGKGGVAVRGGLPLCLPDGLVPPGSRSVLVTDGLVPDSLSSAFDEVHVIPHV